MTPPTLTESRKRATARFLNRIAEATEQAVRSGDLSKRDHDRRGGDEALARMRAAARKLEA